MPRYVDTEKIKYSYLPLAVMPDVFVTKKEIDEMPSEDVAPVVHAQWVYNGKVVYKSSDECFYKCSNCKIREIRVPIEYTEEDILRHYPYCHCGAKMGKKEKTNE